MSEAEFKQIGSQVLGSLHPLRVSVDEGASPYEAKPDAYGLQRLVDSWDVYPPESIDDKELEDMLEYYGLND
jgi:hypothetical protein